MGIPNSRPGSNPGGRGDGSDAAHYSPDPSDNFASDGYDDFFLGAENEVIPLAPTAESNVETHEQNTDTGNIDLSSPEFMIWENDSTSSIPVYRPGDNTAQVGSEAPKLRADDSLQTARPEPEASINDDDSDDFDMSDFHQFVDAEYLGETQEVIDQAEEEFDFSEFDLEAEHTASTQAEIVVIDEQGMQNINEDDLDDLLGLDDLDTPPRERMSREEAMLAELDRQQSKDSSSDGLGVNNENLDAPMMIDDEIYEPFDFSNAFEEEDHSSTNFDEFFNETSTPTDALSVDEDSLDGYDPFSDMSGFKDEEITFPEPVGKDSEEFNFDFDDSDIFDPFKSDSPELGSTAPVVFDENDMPAEEEYVPVDPASSEFFVSDTPAVPNLQDFFSGFDVTDDGNDESSMVPDDVFDFPETQESDFVPITEEIDFTKFVPDADSMIDNNDDFGNDEGDFGDFGFEEISEDEHDDNGDAFAINNEDDGDFGFEKYDEFEGDGEQDNEFLQSVMDIIDSDDEPVADFGEGIEDSFDPEAEDFDPSDFGSFSKPISKKRSVTVDEFSEDDEGEIDEKTDSEEASQEKLKKQKIGGSIFDKLKQKLATIKAEVAAEMRGEEYVPEDNEDEPNRELSVEEKNEQQRLRAAREAAEEELNADEDSGGMEAPQKRGKNGSGKSGGSSGGFNPFRMIGSLYKGIAGFFFKILNGVLQILSSLPIIGRIFKPLLAMTRMIERIAMFAPLVIVVGVIVVMQFITVPLSNTIELPDSGKATISDFSYNNAGMVRGVVENNGDVIADVSVEFKVFAMQPSLNPITWFVPQELATCSSEGVSVDIDNAVEVSAQCDVVSGFFTRATADLVG